MATFAATVKFTEKGLKAIGQTTRRAAAFKTAAQKMGVTVLKQYWSLGTYDGLMLLEAADAQTVAAAMAYLGSLGNVQTQTVQLFTEAEMEKIVKGVGKG
jgi:uncharacterized protein with GYD domain